MTPLPLPLVPAEALAARLDAPDLRIVDCRWVLGDPDHGPRAYASGHVPGAIYLSVDADLSIPEGGGRHPLPSPADFATRLGEVGIGDDHTVVAYDDTGGEHAARLWWMMHALGHQRVGLLDGGWPGWVATGGPQTDVVGAHPPTTHSAPELWPGTIDRDDLGSVLGEVTLIDARAPERYRGETEPVDPVAGHIPTARNLPARDNVDTDGRFLPVAELTRRFSGAQPPVVVYCGSGVTACHAILAMHLAGIDAVLYPGSWSEWSTAGGDIAIGPDPGEAA